MWLTKQTNRRLISGQWESFEFDENTKAKITRQSIVPTIGYDMFLNNLMKYNFTSLPDQSDLDKKIQDSFATKKEYLQSRPSIMGGHEFTIEFKIVDKFRIYRFQTPESYTKYYDNVELRDYVSIQKMFEKDLVKK